MKCNMIIFIQFKSPDFSEEMKEYITFIKEKRHIELDLNSSNIKSENIFNAENIFLPSDDEKLKRKNSKNENLSVEKSENHSNNNNESEENNIEVSEYNSENYEKNNVDCEENKKKENEKEEVPMIEKDACNTIQVDEEIHLKNIANSKKGNPNFEISEGSSNYP